MILCIDDEELGLRVRTIVLERAGYQVAAALDGLRGLNLFVSQPVDLVVLDYFMPEMHGGQVAVEMRRLRPEIPIILLSAYLNLPSEITRTVDCTILKGDGPEVLLGKVRELLSERNLSNLDAGAGFEGS
ncbi:MAG: response regulator [Acidobacteriaceae bacterium]